MRLIQNIFRKINIVQKFTYCRKMSDLRFDGRVVVVTGAGAGLGRAYALLFGGRGASVVVNDLGGSRHGDGSSTKAADTVVQEIRAKGGKAVADYNSVEDGEKIIQTALDNFGRIDVVVNNAGILRDKSFPKISETDWDLVFRVHVKGTFKTTQAAWPHFRKQGYGRIIVTSSTSGLHGNFGQANYSAAKMAVVGLCNTLAIEGQKYNINSNVIVPMAASRLTEDILPPDVFAELRPELIAPVVVWLCHESCTETGSVIKSAAGWAGKYHLVRSPGTVLRAKVTDEVTPEDVRENWGRVTDMSAAKHYTSNAEVTASIMESLEKLKTSPDDSAASGNTAVDVLSYDKRDVILYALGIGATVNNSEDLKFLYEGHEDFSVVPTFLILPAIITLMGSSISMTALPGKDLSPANILHGEQYLEVLKPLSTSGTLTSRARLVDVLDKGSGAVIIVDVETFDEKGEKVAYNQTTTFAVGAGGFGGKRVSNKGVSSVNPPSRTPDAIVKQQTSLDQAAIYRLSGDWNPLHIDPSISALGGFTRPILHGLCSLGFSVRHVLQQYANNDASKFKAVKVRFVKPVIPGQTLQTNMWQEGKRIHFETKVEETGTTVISGAYVDLTEASVAKNQPVKKSQSGSTARLKSDAVFEGLKLKIDANLEKAKKIKGVFVYNITLDGNKAATWTIDLKKGCLYEGPPKDTKADCTLTVGDSDFVDIAAGKLNPQLAFMQGKLKVQGNIMLSQKLRELMKEESKL
ncbi:peroxisomal multifunctional enzyme type 2 [Bacillus rossius redtenbacheri]|uniref:peroxisomal multifunctional enzyme type 2 n=1 Tax=Bacillus rossius redtenbacheri TaxID=93214 RepID=UPI002FDD9D51